MCLGKVYAFCQFLSYRAQIAAGGSQGSVLGLEPIFWRYLDFNPFCQWPEPKKPVLKKPEKSKTLMKWTVLKLSTR
jgi:hypothetical protein